MVEQNYQQKNSPCDTCAVRDKVLCSSLSKEELSALVAIGRRKIYQPGEVITWMGEDYPYCANIVSGVLKLTVSTMDGREQIAGLLFPGDFVGQVFKSKAAMTVTAAVETDLCVYPQSGFEQALDRYSHMERLLLKRTMSALSFTQKRMLSLGKKKAQERIAGFLLEVAKHTGVPNEQGGVDVLVPIGRGELADFQGLAIETVSRQFARLKEEGVIDSSKGDRYCTILDIDRLKAIADPS